MRSGQVDSGSSILEVLAALTILAGATTMIVSGMSRGRPPAQADPVESTSNLVLAARSEAILSGKPVLVRLGTRAIDINGNQHTFSVPLEFVPAGERATPDSEAVFLILPDGTRTGGEISLASAQSRQMLPLVSRGTGL